MYQIEKNANRITKVDASQFRTLDFGEREHLQEWIANEPSALGEELLIIQKEFDGFNDTNERLDLLALDKSGSLVIIENKLDDSGRDVAWQALKYTSYCSGLSRNQIIGIYQKYLDKFNLAGSAEENICEFLEVPDLDEVSLNPGNSQKIILVAGNFRKEVTSTILWLISNGIRAKCMKVTPYPANDQVFLTVEQIVPTKEAEDFMIGMSEKEKDERQADTRRNTRGTLRFQFWEQALDKIKNSEVTIFNNINPTRDQWLNAGSGFRGVPYTLIFGRSEARVELNISRPDRNENKHIFDKLYDLQNEIEQSFGDKLDWRRLDDKKASRIFFSNQFDGYDSDNWNEITNWLIEKMNRFEASFSGPLAEINVEMKGWNGEE